MAQIGWLKRWVGIIHMAMMNDPERFQMTTLRKKLA